MGMATILKQAAAPGALDPAPSKTVPFETVPFELPDIGARAEACLALTRVEAAEIVAQVEPKSLRTFTPTQAVIARSAGVFHWTADGRRLYDFTSGVLVSNLGHNPTRWCASTCKGFSATR